MLVDIRILIAVLMRSQLEIRNTLLKCKRYDPCYKVANKLFELCSCSSILWKVELVSDEMDV